MQRAWPGRLARKIGCTWVLNVSKSSDGCWPCSTISTAASRKIVEVTCAPLPRDRVRVDARVGAGAEHAGLRINDDCRERTHRPRTGDAQLVSARRQAVAHRLRNALL